MRLAWPRALAPVALACALAALASRPAPAAAADRSIDVAILTPTSDGQGLVAVERAATPQRWDFGAALLLGYADNPLKLNLTDASGMNRMKRDLIKGQVTLDVGLSLGLWDFLMLGATLPVAAQWYDQSAVGSPAAAPPNATTPGSTVATGIFANQPRTNIGLANAGPRDPRLLLKGQLYHNDHFGLGLLAALTFPLGNSDSFLGNGGVTFRPALLVDGALGHFALLANVGFIVRSLSAFADPQNPNPQSPSATLFSVGHQLTWAVGASYRLHPLVGLSLEALGAVPLTGTPANTADLLGTVYVYPTATIRLLAGVGGGLVGSSPLQDDVRLVFGLSFSPASRRAPGQESQP